MTSSPFTSSEWQRVRKLREGAELTPAQARELEQLLARADAHEAAVLAPQTAHLRAETQASETQNRQLAALLERRRQLAARLKATLETTRDERREIDRELQRLLQSEESSAALTGVSR